MLVWGFEKIEGFFKTSYRYYTIKRLAWPVAAL
jgi:hypothetical protein